MFTEADPEKVDRALLIAPGLIGFTALILGMALGAARGILFRSTWRLLSGLVLLILFVVSVFVSYSVGWSYLQDTIATDHPTTMTFTIIDPGPGDKLIAVLGVALGWLAVEVFKRTRHRPNQRVERTSARSTITQSSTLGGPCAGRSPSIVSRRMHRKLSIAVVFVVGAILHLGLWIQNVERVPGGGLFCEEEGCYRLVIADLPVSLLYLGGNHVIVTRGSLVVGTVWWGLVAAALFTAALRFLRRG